MRIESAILTNLLQNEEYTRKVLPFLKTDYFTNNADKIVYDSVNEFVNKYNSLPSKEALSIELQEVKINEEEFKEAMELLDDISKETEEYTDLSWLLDTTEKFCQDKAIYNAVVESIGILDDKKSSNDKGIIPDILSDALSVSFDNHIGHDWIEDFSDRYDFYHTKEQRISFDLEYMNLITKGGLPQKTLSCILAGTGVGKSLAMCHFAATNLMDSKKVLYITLEMAEERIAERIDANLLDVDLKELEDLPKSAYIKKVERIRNKTEGKLIIKEYPTATAGTGHFRHLLNELRLKKNFVPDIVYIDYLNICASMRMRYGANVNSYTYIKAIAEEMRGLAVEKNIPIVTATQTTRSGFSNSDPGLEDTSESFGLPATVDLMVALVSSDELESLNQIMVKQLKNRFNDPVSNKRFVIGVDRAKMRLYDVEDNAQKELIDDTPLMDKTEFGMRNEETKKRNFAKLS